MRLPIFLFGAAASLMLLACGCQSRESAAAPQQTPADFSAWTRMADFTGEARGAAWFTVGEAAYVVSGLENDSAPGSKCWKYDGTSNTWSRKADFPGTPFIEGAGFAIGTMGYVGLGGDNNLANLGYIGDLWQYDTLRDTWTKKTPFPGTSRASVAATVIGNKAYIFGGGQWRVPGTAAELWEYDPAADAWTQKADCPGGERGMPIAFAVGSKGYFGLGKLNDPAGRQDFFEYDPEADTWTRKADYPGIARAYAIGISAGSKGYVGMGIGYLPSAPAAKVSAKDLWEYDPAQNAWTQKPDLEGKARSMAIGFALRSKIYFGLGSSDFYSDNRDLWSLAP